MSTDLRTPLPKPNRGVFAGVFVLVITSIALSLYIGSVFYNNIPRTDNANPSGAKKVVANTLPAGWSVQKETGAETAYFAADCASVEECWVVGGPYFMDGIGIILHTIDAGMTWTDITPQDTPGYIYGVDFKPQNTIGVVGRYGKLLISHDRGVTWTNITLHNERGIEDTPIYKLAWNDDSDVWATANTHIYHSADNGQNWNYYHIAEQTVPFGIGCSDLAVCIAGGTGAKAYRTIDRGATWVRSEPANYWNHLLDVDVLSSGRTYMSGGDDQNDTPTYGTGGVIFASPNTGQSWTQLSIPESGDIPSIRCISDTDCMALSADTGTVLRTSDGGTTWTQEVLGYQNRMLGIAYIDSTHAMAVGKGVILRYSAESGGSSPTPTPTPIPAGSGTPTSSPTPTLTSTGTTPTATPTTTPSPSPSFTSSPTHSSTPTSTPTDTLTPSPSPTATLTATPIPTNTPVPTATTPPIPTATPIQNAYCDTACGVCGWRDTSNVCHPEGQMYGSGQKCCYHACVNTSCQLISGYGGWYGCSSDRECGEDRIDDLPQTGRYPSDTPYPRSTRSAPVSGESSWVLILLLPIALILGAVVL